MLIDRGFVLVPHSEKPDICVYGAAFSDCASLLDRIELFKLEHNALQDVPVLLLSTSQMYSDRDINLAMRAQQPMREDFGVVFNSVLAPNAAEILYTLMLENAFMTRKTRTMCLRVFNVYGPSIKHGVVHRFLMAAKRGENLPMQGSEYQSRTFLFEDDFYECIEKCMVKLHNGTRGIYNVGSDVPVTLRELASHVWQFTHGANQEPQIDELPYRGKGQYWKLPDITRVKAIANWTPKMSIRGGLKVLV